MEETKEISGQEAAQMSEQEAAQHDAAEAEENPVVLDGSVGLGVDLISIERVRRVLSRTPRFKMRVYTEEERNYCESTANPHVHYATRFAAKEAVLKALGTGFAFGIAPADVEVTRNQYGRPMVNLHRRAAEIAAQQGVREIPVSLSYTHSDAVACAMAITADSVRVAQERIDPMEELAKQFKDARALLDGLPVRNEDGTQTGTLPEMPEIPGAIDEVDEAEAFEASDALETPGVLEADDAPAALDGAETPDDAAVPQDNSDTSHEDA